MFFFCVSRDFCRTLCIYKLLLTGFFCCTYQQIPLCLGSEKEFDSKDIDSIPSGSYLHVLISAYTRCMVVR